jgi:beta-lactamase superfamily II metal-dependent hydrolase
MEGMELFCYQAECGDAIRIRYIGSDGMPHNIFLDSGYERTFRHVLQYEINSLTEAGEFIDLWIASHIHDDHIGGINKYIKLINDDEFKDITKGWLYNPPRKYAQTVKISDIVSSAKSISQGDRLYHYLLKKNKLPKSDISTNTEYQELFGLKIIILSPTPNAIKELREKYKEGESFERSESDSISQAKSAINFDYYLPLESFNLSEFAEDNSLENRSSISAIFEFEDRKVLWLADSHPSVISESLSNMGYSENNPLECDFVIVSHHASKGNNSSELYNIIKCNNYIISSDGENKQFLPTKEALARIIRNKYRDLKSTYNLYFTYDTSNLREIFLSDGNNIYDKWNFMTTYSGEKCLHIHL